MNTQQLYTLKNSETQCHSIRDSRLILFPASDPMVPSSITNLLKLGPLNSTPMKSTLSILEVNIGTELPISLELGTSRHPNLNRLMLSLEFFWGTSMSRELSGQRKTESLEVIWMS